MPSLQEVFLPDFTVVIFKCNVLQRTIFASIIMGGMNQEGGTKPPRDYVPFPFFHIFNHNHGSRKSQPSDPEGQD